MYLFMSAAWPMAANACNDARSVGRFFCPNSPIPRTMAPELTKTTSTPSRWTEAICLAKEARCAIRGFIA